jgi:integrase
VFLLAIIVTDLYTRAVFIMENLYQLGQPSTAANVTVRRHGPVKGYRPREYLTEREIERLMKAAGDNRWGHRDATAILIAYRHGLRASGLVALRWDDIDSPLAVCTSVRPKAG